MLAGGWREREREHTEVFIVKKVESRDGGRSQCLREKQVKG